jgi:hypothetical protein
MPTVSIEASPVAPAPRAVYSLPDFARPDAVDLPASNRPWRLVTALAGIAAVVAATGYFAWRSGEFPVNFQSPPSAPIAENTKAAEMDRTPAPEESGPASRDTADSADTSATDSAPQAAAPPPVLSAPAGNSGAAAPAPVEAASQMLAKPSPVVPAPLSETEPGIQETVHIPPETPQDVWVTSNPPGAKAVMDGDVSRGCATPCMLQATSGVHHLTVAQDGFQTEYREIHVGDSASEIPMITLRQPTGTLMLITNPAGANIWINGKMLDQTTPAQLPLSPGNYTVTVAKDGRTQTQNIQLHESPLYLRIPLRQ